MYADTRHAVESQRARTIDAPRRGGLVKQWGKPEERTLHLPAQQLIV